jgi:hypothetical protein
MGWCTTHDLDRFLTEAGSYLSSRAAENMLLLAATQSVGDADQDARPAGARRGGRHDAHPGQPGDRAAETTGQDRCSAGGSRRTVAGRGVPSCMIPASRC